jgi:hypothetical protein
MSWHPRGYDIASAARKYGVSVAVVYAAVLSGELSKQHGRLTIFSFLRYAST